MRSLKKQDILFKSFILKKLINLIIRNGNGCRAQKTLYKFFWILNNNKIIFIFNIFKFKRFSLKFNLLFSKLWKKNWHIKKNIYKSNVFIEFHNIITYTVVPTMGLKLIYKTNKRKKKISIFYNPILNERKLLMFGLRTFIMTSFNKPFFFESLISEYNNIKANKGLLLEKKKEMYKLIKLKKYLFKIYTLNLKPFKSDLKQNKKKKI